MRSDVCDARRRRGRQAFGLGLSRALAGFTVVALLVSACSRESSGPEESPESSTSSTEAVEATTTSTVATTTTTVPPGFTYRIAITNEPQTDHQWAQFDVGSDAFTRAAIPDGPSLYRFQYPSNTPVPDAAADPLPPPIEQDGDGFSVTVGLDPAVTWSDGEPVDAGDVVFTFETVTRFGLKGSYEAWWPLAVPDDPATVGVDERRAGVVTVEALDDSTVKVVFSDAVGLEVWPLGVGLAPLFAEHHWGPIVAGSATADEFYAQSGIGAPTTDGYVLEEREPGRLLRSGAVEDYFDRGTGYQIWGNGAVRITREGREPHTFGEPEGDEIASFVQGPYAADIEWIVYPGPNDAALALLGGDVDYWFTPEGMPPDIETVLQQDPEVAVVNNQATEYHYVAFNTRRFPMSDPAFRQALACLFDRDFVARSILRDAVVPSHTHIPSSNVFWNAPDVGAICADLDQAQRFAEAVRILKDGGWTWEEEPRYDSLGSGGEPRGRGLTGPDGQIVEPVTMLSLPFREQPARYLAAEIIADLAGELGLPVVVEPTSFDEVVATVFDPQGTERWDMYVLGWRVGVFPSYIFKFFDSGESAEIFNTTGYASPEFNALSERYAQERTLEGAREIFAEAEGVLNRDLPYLVLFTPAVAEGYRRTIEYPSDTAFGGLQAWDGLGLVARQP